MTMQENDEPFDASTHAVLRRLARKAQGMTGADIARIVRDARRRARREGRSVAYADIESLLADSKPSLSLPFRFRMAVHEAGHAVSRLYFGLGTIEEITIDAPTGGYVAVVFTEAQDQTEEHLSAMLVSMLAGRAAEQEIVGSVCANSGGDERSDLAQATKLAFEMETVFGFAKRAPLLHRRPQDLAAALYGDQGLATRVNARLESAYGIACRMIREQQPAVEFLAEALLEYETLDGAQLDEVVASVRRRMKISD